MDVNPEIKQSMQIVYPPGPKEIIPYRLALKFISNPLPILKDIVNRYGDISHFKFGPRLHVYLVNDPNIIENILVRDNDNFIKSPGLRLAKRVLGNGLITNEGQTHALQRRLIQPAFNKNRIKSYVQVIAEHSLKYTDSNWQDGMVFNIHKEMTKLTLSIISKILFGVKSLTLSELDDISDSITTIIEFINKLRIPFLRFIELLPLPLTRQYKQALSRLDRLIYDKINERRKRIEHTSGNETALYSENTDGIQARDEDMLSILIKSTDDLETNTNEIGSSKNKQVVKMNNQQLRDEVMTIFLAGHETTANALTWTFYLLSQHPEVENKIIDEIASVIGTEDRSVNFEDVSKLKYTEKVLMESMRLYPPSWAIGRQTVSSYILNDKYTIPAGSVVILSQYLVHHDARYFHDPERFSPDRWTKEFRASIPRFSYFPFGGGPRSCIGEPLAWMEGIIILATVLRKWKIILEGKSNIEIQPLVTLRPKFGIKMRIQNRDF